MSDRYEPPFTVADHTKLVAAILARPLHVIKYLDIPKGQPPTTVQVLDAALQVRSFDAATKAHDSPANQEALRALNNGAERDMRIVEGID